MEPRNRALTALLLSACTLGGERTSAPVHDRLSASLPARSLPGIVVVGDDPRDAAEAAVAAGARQVTVPSGTPAPLPLVERDPETLRADADGCFRWDGTRRLPLPEGLRGIVRVDAEQLSGAAELLADRDVVFAWRDPARGLRVAVPGIRTPVDRADLLAVALASARAGVSVYTLPLALAAALVGLWAWLWAGVLARMNPTAAVRATVLAVSCVIGAAWAARVAGLELPFVGLTFAAILPLVGRLGQITTDALDTLDRAVVRLGIPPAETRAPTGLAGIAHMLALYAPGHTVVSWRRSAEGQVVEAHRVTGEGAIPPRARLPAVGESGPGWLVEPVREGAEVIGALGIAAADTIAADVAELVRVLAHAPDAAERPPRGLEPRLALAEQAVAHALLRLERWERLLGAGGAPIAVFDLAGGLLASGATLHPLARGEPALLAVITALTGLEGAPLAVRVRETLAADGPIRIPGKDRRHELVLCPLGPPERRVGLLLELQEVTAWDRLERLRATLHAGSRNTQAALRQIVSLTDPGAPWDPSAVRSLAEATLQEAMELNRALEAGVAGAREALDLGVVASEVAASLPESARAQLELLLYADTPPVAGDAPTVRRLLHLLFVEAAANGPARVALAAEAGDTVLHIEDCAGGLPAEVFDAYLSPSNQHSAPAAARRLAEGLGGRLDATTVPGVHTRYSVRLPRF